jgi:hypothetical protein
VFPLPCGPAFPVSRPQCVRSRLARRSTAAAASHRVPSHPHTPRAQCIVSSRSWLISAFACPTGTAGHTNIQHRSSWLRADAS